MALVNAVISALLLISLPLLNHLANATRIKPGLGGECMGWTIPLMLAMAFAMLERDRKYLDK